MLPRLLFATPTVAACPLAVFGGAVDALLELLPPQPTASAVSGISAAPAKKVMSLLRVILASFGRGDVPMVAESTAPVVGPRETLSATPWVGPRVTARSSRRLAAMWPPVGSRARPGRRRPSPRSNLGRRRGMRSRD